MEGAGGGEGGARAGACGGPGTARRACDRVCPLAAVDLTRFSRACVWFAVCFPRLCPFCSDLLAARHGRYTGLAAAGRGLEGGGWRVVVGGVDCGAWRGAGGWWGTCVRHPSWALAAWYGGTGRNVG